MPKPIVIHAPVSEYRLGEIGIDEKEVNVPNSSPGASSQRISHSMFRSRRVRDFAFAVASLVVFLVGLVGLYQLLEQQKYPEHAARNAAYDHAESNQNFSACNGLPLNLQIICIKDAFNAEGDAQRANEDVNAQKYMASTGFWSWLIGWIQALVAVGGIYYIARTLDANRIAVENAQEANRASWEAVEIARKAADTAQRLGKIQVRAYLSCDGGKIWLGDKGFWIELYLTNRGQSPLFDGDTRGRFGIMGNGMSLDMTSLTGGFGAVSANGKAPCMLFKAYSGIAKADIEGLKSGVGRVYIGTRITWRDVFGEEMWAAFAISQRDGLKTETIDGKEVLTGELRAMCMDAYRDEI